MKLLLYNNLVFIPTIDNKYMSASIIGVITSNVKYTKDEITKRYGDPQECHDFHDMCKKYGTIL